MSMINPQWWLGQIAWGVQMATSLAGSQRFSEFLTDAQEVARLFVHALDSVPFGKPLRLFAWAMSHTDPLKPARDRMNAMRKKWSA